MTGTTEMTRASYPLASQHQRVVLMAMAEARKRGQAHLHKHFSSLCLHRDHSRSVGRNKSCDHPQRQSEGVLSSLGEKVVDKGGVIWRHF